MFCWKCSYQAKITLEPPKMCFMIDKAVEPVQKVGLWLSSRPNNLRLREAGVEIIALIIAREPENSVLLVQSPYHKTWVRPQESVHLYENSEDALHMCTQVERGVELPPYSVELEKAFYLCSIQYLGTLDRTHERWGERRVVDDAAGTSLELIKLSRKAYYKATPLFADSYNLNPKADGKEFLNFQEFRFEDAKYAILNANHRSKAKLLVQALMECKRDIAGVPKLSA